MKIRSDWCSNSSSSSFVINLVGLPEEIRNGILNIQEVVWALTSKHPAVGAYGQNEHIENSGWGWVMDSWNNSIGWYLDQINDNTLICTTPMAEFDLLEFILDNYNIPKENIFLDVMGVMMRLDTVEESINED